MKTKKSLILLGVILAFFSTTPLSHATSLTSMVKETVYLASSTLFGAGDDGALSSTDLLLTNDPMMAAPSGTSGGFIDSFQNSTNSFTGTEELITSVDGSLINQPESGALQCDDTPTSAPVPEPATMLLLGTGLAGLAGAKLRRKSKK